MKIIEIKSLDGWYQFTVGEQGINRITFDESEMYFMIYKGAYFLDLRRTLIVVPANSFMAVFEYEDEDELIE